MVLYDGDNDIAGGMKAEGVLAGLRTLTQMIHDDLPETKIIVLAVKTSKSRWKIHEEMRRANALMAAFAETEPGITFLDADTPLLDAEGVPRDDFFREDHLHLNPEGYRIWTDLLKPLLAD